MRDHRFHSFTEEGADAFARVLREDGFVFVEVAPSTGQHPGWSVHGSADGMNEGLLETLAQFYGGCYEGEDLAPG
jgi:hypothetical protein